jgi:hypothetical protein
MERYNGTFSVHPPIWHFPLQAIHTISQLPFCDHPWDGGVLVGGGAGRVPVHIGLCKTRGNVGLARP